MLKYSSSYIDIIPKEIYSYLNEIYPLMNVIENKRVFEIGPGPGFHTDLMLTYSPSQIVSIEPDERVATQLTLRYGDRIKVLHEDALLYIKNYDKFDVVVMFGLLYHFHSPFHLLELVANYNDPEHIFLEIAQNDSDEAGFDDERVNELAQRVVKKQYKTINYCLTFGEKFLEKAMQDLGYVAKVKLRYDEKHSYKSNQVFYHFEKLS